jgi:flagellar biosynthesis/type III secretory pathway protein FliH
VQVSSRVSVESLRKTTRALLDPKVEEAIVTSGQQLIEQGRLKGLQQGRQEGVQKGIEEGVQKGQRAMLLNLLRARFGELPGWVAERVESGTSQDTEEWACRVLSVATLEGVFA